MTPHRNEVKGKIGNKEDVAGADLVCSKHHVKVQTHKGIDRVASTDKVRGNGFLMEVLAHVEVIVAKCGGAGLWRDPKDDDNVAWEGATK